MTTAIIIVLACLGPIFAIGVIADAVRFIRDRWHEAKRSGQ